MAAFGPSGALAQEFEAAMRDADSAADRRFEHCRRRRAASRSLAARSASRTTCWNPWAWKRRGLAQERTALDAAWAALWSGSSVSAARSRRDDRVAAHALRILDLTRAARGGRAAHGAWQQREAEAKRLVWPNLMRWGFPRRLWPASRSISSSRPRRRRNAGTKTPPRRGAISRHAHRKATGVVTRKRKDLEKAEAEWTEWTSAWQAALKALQLAATATPETAEAQINAIDDMREAAVRINDLRHERIEKIERDVKAFEADVAALAQAIAPHLSGTDPEEAVLELDRLAADASARAGPEGREGFLGYRRLAGEDR